MLGGIAVIPAYASDEPIVLSSYASDMGANQEPRSGPHAGVDFGGLPGDPVLAAADGTVSLLIDYRYGCGIGVIISHPAFGRWTAYCHMQKGLVRVGQRVSRGETIGLVGSSGKSGDVPHVHFELCTTACSSHRDGDLAGTEDPLAVIDGCFDPGRHYPTERMVLTFPLRCTGERARR
jgi:murein DD-endopeptidase MepM/ murein hydrolase activator NlpD